MKSSSQIKISTQVKIGSLKLLFSVPKSWSINKLKCLLTSEIPSLDFDEFQICNKGKLQRGNYKIGELVSNNANKRLELQIIKTKSEVKFSEYYKNSMQNFMSIGSYSKQPILSTEYQKYKNLTKQPNNQNMNENIVQLNIDQIQDEGIIGNNPNNPAHPLLRLLRLLGIYFLLVLIYDHGKIYQIASMLIVVILYYVVEIFVKYKQKKLKKNQQNRENVQEQQQRNTEPLIQEENQGENKSDKQKKGLIKLYQYKVLEVIFCFFLTFFPNLTIDIHLDINKTKIQKARKQINFLIPNTFPNPQRINVDENN